MQVFQTLGFVVLVLSSRQPEVAPNSSTSLSCGAYEFRGSLSSDLKKKPLLVTQTSSGIPIEIELQLKGHISFEAIGLRGKTVKASIDILKKSGPRNYIGRLTSVELDVPYGLKPNPSESARLISLGKCSEAN
ncbi:MAG: hypothetical protein JWQ35_2159 [Bacteriovoracaceae bacterium]|nr:hypothetical protein [Bacteriovoracaceae bacterium]